MPCFAEEEILFAESLHWRTPGCLRAGSGHRQCRQCAGTADLHHVGWPCAYSLGAQDTGLSGAPASSVSSGDLSGFCFLASLSVIHEAVKLDFVQSWFSASRCHDYVVSWWDTMAAWNCCRYIPVSRIRNDPDYFISMKLFLTARIWTLFSIVSFLGKKNFAVLYRFVS